MQNYCAHHRFDTEWVEGYGQPPLMPITVARNIKELACEVRAAIRRAERASASSYMRCIRACSQLTSL